jgi:hypothetical protein
MALGLVLGVVALFMAPMSIRELATAWNRDSFVRDEFEVDAFRESRGGDSSDWLEAHVVSTGEPFATDRTEIVGRQRLVGLREGTKGYRVPVWYLPPGGAWPALDRVVEFRVRSLDDFEQGLPVGLVMANGVIGVASALFIRRVGRLSAGMEATSR